MLFSPCSSLHLHASKQGSASSSRAPKSEEPSYTIHARSHGHDCDHFSFPCLLAIFFGSASFIRSCSLMQVLIPTRLALACCNGSLAPQLLSSSANGKSPRCKLLQLPAASLLLRELQIAKVQTAPFPPTRELQFAESVTHRECWNTSRDRSQQVAGAGPITC